MKVFMIFIKEDIAKLSDAPAGEQEAYFHDWKQWVAELTSSGNYHSGGSLDHEGRYLAEGKVLSDGPFIEAKEAVTGYFKIKAQDIEHAVGLVKDCPVYQYDGALEIRPIMVY